MKEPWLGIPKGTRIPKRGTTVKANEIRAF